MRRSKYRVKFVYDEDAQFEECNGENRPLTSEEYAENEYLEHGKPVPYDRYLEYYGNPDRHVYLGCIAQRQCSCCEEWVNAASVWGIDFMDDSPELKALIIGNHYYTPQEVLVLPGYVRDVALDELMEAGYKLPKHVYCTTAGCKYRHVTEGADTTKCTQHQPKGKR